MSGKLLRHSYVQLIKENIEWLLSNTPDSLERKHIIAVLLDSIDKNYPKEERSLREFLEWIEEKSKEWPEWRQNIGLMDKDRQNK